MIFNKYGVIKEIIAILLTFTISIVFIHSTVRFEKIFVNVSFVLCKMVLPVLVYILDRLNICIIEGIVKSIR